MVELLFWMAVGIVIGWNVLPQPVWAKALLDKYMKKFKKD